MSTVDVQRIPAQQLTTRVQTGGVEVLEQIAEDWRRLCDESGDEEIFYRPEWALAYLRAFAPREKITLISVWSDKSLRGILPLVRHRSFISGLPVVILTVPANVHCFRVGLSVCKGEEGEAALHAIWQAVKNLSGWNVIDVSNVVESNGIDRLSSIAHKDGFPVARKRTSQTLFLPIPAAAPSKTKDAQPPWLAGTRPKFRSHLRRAHRQLEEQGGKVALKHYATADPAALAKFYELEGSGWKGEEGTAIKCDPRTLQFYNQIAQAAARDGYLSLDFLELDEKPIAAHFGFNLRGRYFLAKAGYNEEYRRFGPGQLLVNEVLGQTPQRGLREFDFVGPATWDESRWASARRTSYRIFIFRKNLYGELLHDLRISVRDMARSILGHEHEEDEGAPLELKSKPQGADKETGGEA